MKKQSLKFPIGYIIKMTITFIGLRTVFVCFNYVALLDVALEVETVKWGLLIMATMLFADWKLREHE